MMRKDFSLVKGAFYLIAFGRFCKSCGGKIFSMEKIANSIK
jgi:hypothetical protein